MNREKYSRQILFPPIGAEGQAKLLESRAVILGCGALGTAQANALTRAGVGTLRIVDRDFVEESNLQRQILFDEADARERLPKAIAAARKLNQINSEVKVEGVVEDVDNRNIEKLVSGFQVVLDATDNFEARYLLNVAAVKHRLPWVYGAVVASYGMSMTILPESTACLACLFPAAPEGAHETCDTAGVISPAVSWVAAIQVTEMETMPMTFPLSTTGRCRTRCSVMSFMQSSTESCGLTVMTTPVKISRTRVSLDDLPCNAILRA